MDIPEPAGTRCNPLAGTSLSDQDDDTPGSLADFVARIGEIYS